MVFRITFMLAVLRSICSVTLFITPSFQKQCVFSLYSTVLICIIHYTSCIHYQSHMIICFRQRKGGESIFWQQVRPGAATASCSLWRRCHCELSIISPKSILAFESWALYSVKEATFNRGSVILSLKMKPNWKMSQRRERNSKNCHKKKVDKKYSSRDNWKKLSWKKWIWMHVESVLAALGAPSKVFYKSEEISPNNKVGITFTKKSHMD